MPADTVAADWKGWAVWATVAADWASVVRKAVAADWVTAAVEYQVTAAD